MKAHKQWWNWAVIAATSLAFALQGAVEVKAQNAQVMQDSQGPQGAQDQSEQPLIMITIRILRAASHD